MSQIAGKLLAIGLRDRWPEPLHSLVARGELQIELVASVHEAAARGVAERPACAGILSDSEMLTRAEMKMVSVLKRHLNLPMWVLPGVRKRSGYQETLAMGALPLEEGMEIRTFLLQTHTQVTGKGNSGILPENKVSGAPAGGAAGREGTAARADNQPDPTVGNKAEIPVTAGLATRYDEPGTHVSLSEREVRALLGSAE